MPNETEDYNNFVRANLPAGMSYSANRYRYNNHSFYVFELAAWYYYYLLRVNSPSNLFSASEVGVWYDPSDVGNLAWRYNRLLYSEQLDNAVWTKTDVTVVSNTATAPDGTMTADAVVPTVTLSSAKNLVQTAAGLTVGQTYVFTAYAKASGYNFVRLGWTSLGAFFNVSSGTVGTVFGGATASITSVGDGWYRCSVAAVVADALIYPVIYTQSSDAQFSTWTGDGSSRVLLWGTQFELGSTATSYQRISDVNTEVRERFPLATLFQDSAGTTPVTAAGQPVGLMLDKSKGLALGSELVSNGDFSNGVTGWISVGAANISVASGEAQVTNVTNYADRLEQNLAGSVSGKTYLISFDARVSSGTARISAAQNGGAFSTLAFREINNTITQRMSLVATTTGGVGMNVRVVPYSGNAAQIVYVDNVSVKEIAGNHATQATSAQRPTYGIHPYSGVRNRLKYTEQFDDASWTKQFGSLTSTNVAAPDGSLTADVFTPASQFGNLKQLLSPTITSGTVTVSVWLRVASGTRNIFIRGTDLILFYASEVTVTTTWTRFTATFTHDGTNAINFLVVQDRNTSGFVPIEVWGAQLEVGSAATAYQKVVTQYEITEAGVPSVHYIGFDGVDDGMVTSAINFSATNKVTLFAGIRKLSDTSVGIVAELGPATFSTDGSFALAAPNSGPNYSFLTRGTVASVAASPITYTSPITNVLSCSFDNSGSGSAELAQIKPRINGVGITGVSGTTAGNYANAALNIGRRSGPVFPFNGNLYSLIVRGAQSTDSQITNTETWVNQKTGAY